MHHVSLDEARTDLRNLVARVAGGETILITEDGKPLATLAPAAGNAAATVPRRLGFLAGQFAVPADFDSLGEREIATLFGTLS